VTNGTAAGTYELTDISGAHLGGIFFVGVDASDSTCCSTEWTRPMTTAFG
jgi:hypothetical protein